MTRWANWAGNQSSRPSAEVHPADVAEVASAVRTAIERGMPIKATGTGHSFSGIARPEGVRLVLDRLTGGHSIDEAGGTVTVGAGTTLARLNELLTARGRALTNLGDIDRQTVAGAIATETHGTGATFGSLSTLVVGLEMVTPDGTLVRCSPAEDTALWAAARVGLGALGVVTAVTLQTVELFALRAEEGPMPLDELLDRFDELWSTTDHFEAYWFPHTRATLTKRNTRVPMAEGLDRLPRWREWRDDELLSNAAFGAVVAVGRCAPVLVPVANGVAARALGARTFTDVAHRVFTSPRRVRFCEMEYAIPRDAAVPAIREAVAAIDRSGLRVAFPVEIRVSAADDIPLSPASDRPSAHLAFHTPAAVDFRPYFTLMDRVLAPYAARPHWGKLHPYDASNLRELYPRFDEFVALRDSIDPTGALSNRYLDRVLGRPPAARPSPSAPRADPW